MAKKKKFVYFLGAGASYGAGSYATVQAGGRLSIPTQATFWDTFLRFCKNKRHRQEIESFLFRYFLGYGRSPTRLTPSERRKLVAHIDVEEVFTFLSERARAPSTSPQLRTYVLGIWDALTSEMGNVFARFNANKSTREIYRCFIRQHFRKFDSIVSFNYDTVFENSMTNSHPTRYVGVDRSNENIPLLKPHGSINWEKEPEGSIKICKLPSRPVIVAPTHLKFVAANSTQEDGSSGYLDQVAEIQSIWTEMESRMRDARALVFIGYSFPVADLYFSSVLRSVLADRYLNPDVVVVNPDAVAIADRITRRFAIPKVIRYFDLRQFAQATRKNVIDQLER